MTPGTKFALQHLSKKMGTGSKSECAAIYSEVKQSYRRCQEAAQLPPKVPSSREPVDLNAFGYYSHKSTVQPEWRGKSRAECNADNPNYNADDNAGRAKRRAVRGIVDAVQSVGDEDQIALALMGALEHPEIRPYMGRIVGSFNTEAAKVGLRAVDGMKSLVDLVAGKRATGGRSKQCRALLIAIAMCVTHELDDKVSKEAVIRQIFPAISRAAAQRLLKTAGKKRKRLEEEELYDFRMVDEERKRWKYTDEIILNLRHYMCNNIYTRDSPNSKDTIRERDTYGKCTIHSSLSYPKLISGLIVYFLGPSMKKHGKPPNNTAVMRGLSSEARVILITDASSAIARSAMKLDTNLQSLRQNTSTKTR